MQQNKQEKQMNEAQVEAQARLKEVAALVHAGEVGQAIELANVLVVPDMAPEDARKYLARIEMAGIEREKKRMNPVRELRERAWRVEELRERERGEIFDALSREANQLEAELGEAAAGLWRTVQRIRVRPYYETVDAIADRIVEPLMAKNAGGEMEPTGFFVLSDAEAVELWKEVDGIQRRVGGRFASAWKAREAMDARCAIHAERAMEFAVAGRKVEFKRLMADIERDWGLERARQVRDYVSAGNAPVRMKKKGEETPPMTVGDVVAAEVAELVPLVPSGGEPIVEVEVEVVDVVDQLAGMATAAVASLLDAFQVDLARRGIEWTREALDLDLMQDAGVEEALDAAVMVVESELAAPEVVAFPKAFAKVAQRYVDDILSDGGYKTATAWAAQFEAAWGVALVVTLPPEVVAASIVGAWMRGDVSMASDDAAAMEIVAGSTEIVLANVRGADVRMDFERVDRVLDALDAACGNFTVTVRGREGSVADFVASARRVHAAFRASRKPAPATQG